MGKTGWLLLFAIAARAAETTYSIQTVAGSSLVGDGGSALNAQLSDAQGLAVDRFGAVYIADPDNHRVRKVNLSGIVETLAGTGLPGFSGDGGPATGASLNAPYGVAVDVAGNVYVADLGNNRVRKIAPGGTISTVSGTGQAGSEGDGGPASAAQLHSPRNLAVDGSGNLYIAEFEGHRIRLISVDGLIHTVAGTGTAGARGDGGPATAAELAYPAGLLLDFTGTLYIADSGNRKIRRLINGVLNTLPFTGFTLNLPTGICADGANGLYIADSGNRRVLRRTYLGAVAQVSVNAVLDSARDVAADGFGNLLIADGRRVRLLTAFGYSTTLAGDGVFGYRGDGGPATLAVLNGPDGVAAGADGVLYIADGRNHRVRAVSPAGDISTVAGNGTVSSDAAVIAPEGLYSDPGGVLWIGERFGARVRRLVPGGALLTVAGTGAAGFNGDSRAATGALLQTPGQVALDPAGDLYIADAGNNRIRKVTASGTITTVAGTGIAGFSGDGGQGVSAQLDGPRGIAFDAAGNLFIADTNNHRIRKVAAGGLITTVTGEGELPLRFPRSLAVDSSRNLYIADTGNHRIVKSSPAGEQSVIAGLGRAGFGGDGGAALAALLSSPAAIALDGKGNLYIADLDNNRVRELTPSIDGAPPPAPITQAPAALFLNAAALTEGPVAPGEILTIVAGGIGPEIGALGGFEGSGLLSSLLSETQVLFDGRAAPLFEAQPDKVVVQVPYETARQAVSHVEMYRAGQLKAAATLVVTPAAPGIFTIAGAAGPALVTNADGSRNSDENPADPGSVVTLFATGEGQTDPAGVTGMPSAEPFPRPLEEIVVRVGGRPAEILLAREAPGKVGVLQIDAVIPTIVNAGPVVLSLSVGSADSQAGVTVYIR